VQQAESLQVKGIIIMGSVGPTELLIVALVAILLFGGSRIANLGKGLGQGIKNFKQGLKGDDEQA
jgi:sec-independent protein translocase protein TatA